MKHLLLHINLLFLFIANMHAQDIQLNLNFQNSIQGKFNLFNIDELGSIYVLTSGGQIKKYNANTDSLAVFNDGKRYGQLHSMHTENSLRTLLFFQNFNTAILLDRMMQVVQKIDLRKLGLFQVSAVAPSYDNRLWLFDQQNNRIKKIDFDGSLVFESSDLRLIFDDVLHPHKMIEHQGSIYLLDSLSGIYIFDYYGGFKKKINLSHVSDIQSLGDMLIGKQGEKYFIKGENDVDVKWMSIPSNIQHSKHLYFSRRMLYSLNDDKISLYSYTFKP